MIDLDLENDLVKIGQAAKITGFTVGTIYVYVHKRKIPFVKTATGSLRFSVEGLKKWMRNGKM